MEANNKQIVLIVDDSLLICEQIKAALKESPYLICESHNGREALDMVRQYHPDLILLDVVLPDTDGYQLFNELKKEAQNESVIIFLTSKDKDEDVVRGFAMGAYDYIKKPFVKGELASRVNTHLQIKRQKDELNRLNRELRTNMEKLNFMAFRDGLTGLYNRRYVVGDLLEDMKDQNREDAGIYLLLADIDDFKQVNDTYGHDAGDMVLVCIANILEGICRRHKVIRWGGEEFLIVLFAVTQEEVNEISERIRSEVEHFPMFHDGHDFRCTLTLGIHSYQEKLGLEECINCADKALYYGKRRGKNCCIWYKNIE